MEGNIYRLLKEEIIKRGKRKMGQVLKKSLQKHIQNDDSDVTTKSNKEKEKRQGHEFH